jgi:hypothetical protein
MYLSLCKHYEMIEFTFIERYRSCKTQSIRLRMILDKIPVIFLHFSIRWVDVKISRSDVTQTCNVMLCNPHNVIYSYQCSHRKSLERIPISLMYR